MKLLVLGGTVFLGRGIVEEAIARGHEVTLFHRGQRGAELFIGQVERVTGDRDGGLDVLGDRFWDAVVDTSGYLPRVVGDSARFFRDKCNRYLFISTISVYETKGVAHIDESSPLKKPLDDPKIEEVNGDTYGPLKVMCEQAVDEVFGSRATIVRPGVIIGPNDPSDRFTYWTLRMHRGGDVVVPNRPDQPSQLIDVRDLSAFCLDLLERDVSGAFNTVPPPVTLGFVLETCREVAGTGARLVWVAPEKLEELGVKPWSELPLYLGADASEDVMERVDATRAIDAGLRFRGLADSARDTLDWALTRGDVELRAGLKPERESEILAAVGAQRF